MNLINDINTIINTIEEKIKSTSVQENKFKLEYYKGQLIALNRYKSFLSLNIDLTHKDCLEYLDRIYYKSEQSQIKFVGFENKTGKPNLVGCFYLGKMNAIKQLKNNLFN